MSAPCSTSWLHRGCKCARAAQRVRVRTTLIRSPAAASALVACAHTRQRRATGQAHDSGRRTCSTSSAALLRFSYSLSARLRSVAGDSHGDMGACMAGAQCAAADATHNFCMRRGGVAHGSPLPSRRRRAARQPARFHSGGGEAAARWAAAAAHPACEEVWRRGGGVRLVAAPCEPPLPKLRAPEQRRVRCQFGSRRPAVDACGARRAAERSAALQLCAMASAAFPDPLGPQQQWAGFERFKLVQDILDRNKCAARRAPLHAWCTDVHRLARQAAHQRNQR